MTDKLQIDLLLGILRRRSDEKIIAAKENLRKHQKKTYSCGLLDVEQSP